MNTQRVTFALEIGQQVYSHKLDGYFIVVQKRVKNNAPWYRLDCGSILPEFLLL